MNRAPDLVIKTCNILLIAITSLLLFAGCTHPAHAADKQFFVSCGLKQLHFTQHNDNPVILDVYGVRGTYMMVPGNKPEAYYINLETESVVSVQLEGSDFRIKFFKNVEDTQVDKPQENLVCHQS